MEIKIKVSEKDLYMLNQLFEIEEKLKKLKDENSIQRNIDRLKNYFENEAYSDGKGLIYHNPIGESYDVTRTDCEATIAGECHDSLKIIEVLKPIIYVKFNNSRMITQKAVVIVQSIK